MAAGIAATGNQATQQRLGRALDTRPTIEVDSGQLCQVLLTKPLICPRCGSKGGPGACHACLGDGTAGVHTRQVGGGGRQPRGSRSFGAKNNDPLEVFVFTGLFERLFWLGWGVRGKPQRWGRKPCSWAKYHSKRGQNQEFSSAVCVDEDLRFPPQLDHSLMMRFFCTPATGTPERATGMP